VTVTESPPLSAVPNDFEPFESFDAPKTGSDLICEECAVTFTHAGRGRKPKRCPEHRARRASAGSRPRAQRPSVTLLGDAVTMNLRTLGSILSLVNQYDGQVIMAGAPVFGNACANVAEHDARFRRMLEGSATGIVYGELIAAALIMILPILANHGMIPERVMTNVAGMYAGMGAAPGGSSAVPNG
jgi:hypothetical protein